MEEAKREQVEEEEVVTRLSSRKRHRDDEEVALDNEDFFSLIAGKAKIHKIDKSQEQPTFGKLVNRVEVLEEMLGELRTALMRILPKPNRFKQKF